MKIGARQFFDPGRVLFFHPLENETVRCDQSQAVASVILTFQAQRTNPGIELLLRQFLFELTQARIPETAHDKGTEDYAEGTVPANGGKTLSLQRVFHSNSGDKFPII